MTCIVGVEHGGLVHLGGDSASGGEWLTDLYRAPKVFRAGPFVMGYTTSFRMGQLLEHALVVPEQLPSVPDERHMATAFVDAVRSCLKAGGFARVENGVEQGGVFLIGYRGRLYRMDNDYHVGSSSAGYASCGSGEQVALGALHALGATDPEPRLRLALEAAERFVASVRGPFTIVSGAERPS